MSHQMHKRHGCIWVVVRKGSLFRRSLYSQTCVTLPPTRPKLASSTGITPGCGGNDSIFKRTSRAWADCFAYLKACASTNKHHVSLTFRVHSRTICPQQLLASDSLQAKLPFYSGLQSLPSLGERNFAKLLNLCQRCQCTHGGSNGDIKKEDPQQYAESCTLF